MYFINVFKVMSKWKDLWISVGISTLSELRTKRNTFGSVKNKIGRGRKRKTTKRNYSYLKNLVLSDRKASNADITKQYNSNLSEEQHISKSTAKRRLHEHGISPYRCKKNYYLQNK